MSGMGTNSPRVYGFEADFRTLYCGKERPAHNPLVGGSSPPGPTIFFVIFQSLTSEILHGAVDY